MAIPATTPDTFAPTLSAVVRDSGGYTLRTDAFGRHCVLPPPAIGSETVRMFPQGMDGYLRAVEWCEGLSAAYLAGLRVGCKG